MSQSNNNSRPPERYYQIFIEQAPSAIAMLDKSMVYVAVSQRWLRDYKLERKDVIGRCHYDVFPEIGDDWREKHQKCLNGAIDTCEEAPFQRKDGSIQWIYWDVRPWYESNGKIGGLLMHTGDITRQKEKELEKIRIETILKETNEIARIGTWDLNLLTNEVYWSTIVRQIHEVSDNFKPNLEKGINFFKKGKSRNEVENALNNAIAKGTFFDLEAEITTAKGNNCWVRAIGKAELVNGKAVRVFGMLQDINSIKLSEQHLNKAHAELGAIFDSKSIAVISTDKHGIINGFNAGPEMLLGYSADEVEGIETSEIYLQQDEIVKFKQDMAQIIGGDLTNIDDALLGNSVNNTREWNFRRKDGTIFPALTSVTSIINDQGKNDGFIAVATDISEIKKVENELLKKNELLNFAEQITLIGHWQWDVAFDRVEWSQNLYKVFELDQITNHLNFDTYFNFVHAEDKEIVKKYFENAAKNKVLEKFTHRIRTTSGKVKAIQLLGKVLIDDKGNLTEMIGTCQDVTEIKMAEKKFRGLLESAPDAMVIVNDKGAIQLINKQSERLFGYAPEELYNKSVEVLIPTKYSSIHTHYRKRFFENPNTREMGEGLDLFALKKNGEEIPIQISLSPLHTEEGLLVSAAIRDITKQKQAERNILEAKKNLEVIAKKLSRQNKQLADFTHITSHNLRAPVANLNSLMELYQLSQSETDRLFIFQKFDTVIQHLSLTLNTLIEALKTKIGDSNEGLEVVDLNEVFKNTIEILSGAILKSNAKIVSDFSAASTIRYNKVYLESIFLNLIGNAIKYKSEKRIPEIYVTSQIENGKIILKFKDNGLGIDLERHGHKLFGLNKVFHRHPEAKGVGLFLTKTQIEAMGGEISAASKINEGTTFTINFN